MSSIRAFSTKDPSDDKPVGSTESDVKKAKTPRRAFATSKIEVLKPKRDAEVVAKKDASVQPKNDGKSKMEALVKDAQEIQSVGPNDKGSVSQSIGKPKTFVRQSARQDPTAKFVAQESATSEA